MVDCCKRPIPGTRTEDVYLRGDHLRAAAGGSGSASHPRSARSPLALSPRLARQSIEESITRPGCSLRIRLQGVGIRLGGDLTPGKVPHPLRPSATQGCSNPRVSVVNSAERALERVYAESCG